MSRNVVLLTVDSLRADHCGFMGYDADTTPNLDEKAADGVVYENAIAPSSATPFSMPGIFTGIESQASSESFDSRRERIRNHVERHRTIQERFSARGYTTIGFTPNPFTSRHFGFDEGFDHFQDFLDADGLLDLRSKVVSRWANDGFVAGLRFGMNMIGLGDISMSWEDYYEDLLAVVEDAPEPFFLWVFLLEPHWPYRPPRRYREPSLLDVYRRNWKRAPLSDATLDEDDAVVLRNLYDGTIRHVDEFVGRLTEDLAEHDPAYVFHADHGEAFGDHGNFGHGPHVFEENVNVPLVCWNVDETERVEEPISLRRIPELLQDVSTDGWEVDRQSSPWVVASTGRSRTVRGQSVKVVCEEGEPDRLFLLEDDPHESEPATVDDSSLGETLFARVDVPQRERLLIAKASADVARGGDSRAI